MSNYDTLLTKRIIKAIEDKDIELSSLLNSLHEAIVVLARDKDRLTDDAERRREQAQDNRSEQSHVIGWMVNAKTAKDVWMVWYDWSKLLWCEMKEKYGDSMINPAEISRRYFPR